MARPTAHSLKRLVLEYPQNLCLGLCRHFSDVIEEERAAVSLLESADPPARRCLPLDSKQFDLHSVRCHRCGVYDHEGTVRSSRLLVHHARNDLFA